MEMAIAGVSVAMTRCVKMKSSSSGSARLDVENMRKLRLGGCVQVERRRFISCSLPDQQTLPVKISSNVENKCLFTGLSEAVKDSIQ
jgi:hypothetical protein